MMTRPVDPVSSRTEPTEPTWPRALWLVRHGESAGNVARDAAEAAGLPLIDITARDVDVELSGRGRRQSRALGRWFGALAHDEQPTVVMTSPFVRASETAQLLIDEGGLRDRRLAHVVDERLREKEFGVLNRLTKAGILARFPEEAERRGAIGKFYYRPPGGESWCDVILRLRSVLDHIQLRYRGERVLIVAHQVVVMCFRYLLEDMTEAQLLAIDREKSLANCSVTSYAWTRGDDGRECMRLQLDNFVSPLEEAGAPVTTTPDAPRPT